MKSRLIVAGALALFATSALAHKMSLTNGEEAIAYRHAAFGLLAANFGDIAAQVQGKKPFDPAIIEKRVANVAALAQMPWEAFAVEGSDQGKENEALPEVWTKAEDFAAAQKVFFKAVDELQAAGSDQEKLGAAVASVGKACKGCHNAFKS